MYWAAVKGTTDSLPCRTRGESAKIGSALICASDTGFASAFPALIFTAGVLGFDASTETTDRCSYRALVVASLIDDQLGSRLHLAKILQRNWI